MTKSAVKIFLTLLLLLYIMPSPAHAHFIGGNGFASGMIHPLFGLDHLLAMVAVGIIGTQIGGRAKWLVPGAFILFMIMGGSLVLLRINFPFIETGIALSVLMLGAAIALSKKLYFGQALAMIALFAIFHGQAHGAEMPQIANPVFYAAGFILSTAVLHIFGILIGQNAARTNITFRMLRLSGAAISLAGLFFLLGF